MEDFSEGLTVPETWQISQLKNVCTKITDGTHKTPKYKDKGIRFISIKNIRPYQPVNWDSYIKYISLEEHNDLIKRCKPEFDDVLFPRIGTLGFAKRIDFKEEISIFVGLGLLKPNKEVLYPKYLEYWMNHPLICQLSREKATGSGRLTLPLAETRKFPIPIAPLEQQIRIVAEIEKQFSRLDEAVDNLKRVKANLKRYKAAVLKAAVEGKLTEEWRKQHPDVEPADKLLERILAERREKWQGRGKYKEPAAPDTTDLPELPRNWTGATVKQLSLFSFYGPRFSSDKYSDTGAYVLRTTDISESGRVNTQTAPRITLTESDFNKYRIESGDLLVTRTGSLGRLALFEDDVDAIPGAYLIQFRLLLDWYARRFLFLCLKSMRGQAYLTGGGAGVGRPNINAPTIEAFSIFFPPQEEQQQIVLDVERRFSNVEEIEGQIDANLQRAVRLRQSILIKAFSGNLI